MTKTMMTIAALAAGLTVQAAETVTLGSLLREMTDVDANTYLPETRFMTRLWSSYDRKSTTSDQSDGFANGDYNQYVRTDRMPDGTEELVMLEAKGPGAIVRFWITVSGEVHKGRIRMYIDGNLAYEDNCLAFVSGGLFCPAPLSDSVSKQSELERRGHDLYLPIPYAKSCKVAYIRPKNIKGSFYYNVETRTYPEGTAVESLTPEVLAREAPAIAAANRALARRQAGADKLTDETVRFDGAVAPGGSVTRELTRADGGAIRFLGFTLTGAKDETYLRSTVLEMTFDGERTVWVPVGEFFGCGGLYESYTSWFTSCPGTDQFESRWTMPFAKTCRVTLHNYGGKPVQVSGSEIAVGPYRWDAARSLHFGACWHDYYDVESRRGPEKSQWDFNFVELTGEGFFTGTTLTLWQPHTKWWGEGDEKVYVDGEKAPSYIGTGTEDYFGYAWCRPQPFSHPFIAQAIGIKSDRRLSAQAERRSVVNVRNRALDAIPFTKSIRFDMEMWHWTEDVRIDFAPLATWYARPGVKANWGDDVEAVRRKVRFEYDPKNAPKAAQRPAAPAAETVTIESLLRDMIDPDANTYLAKTPFMSRQWSSTDRRTKTPDDPAGWFANGDSNQFLRYDEVGGERRKVMIDAKGPGALVRWWNTCSGDHGTSLKLVVEIDGVKFYEGSVFKFASGGALCGAPLSDSLPQGNGYDRRGHDLYLPIPYAKSLLVYVVETPETKSGCLFYNIETRTYADGTSVEPLTKDALARAKPFIDRVNAELMRPAAAPVEGRTTSLAATLKPGERLEKTVFADAGGAAVRQLLCSFGPDPKPQHLRSTVLEISFDGERTVWAPVGDFFSVGCRYSKYESYFTSASSDGLLAARWTMPFEKEMRISLKNVGNEPVKVARFDAVVAPYRWDAARSLHFGAGWHSLLRVPARLNGYPFDVNYVELTGEGYLVGTSVALFSRQLSWWGEGDEKIFVDGERFPSFLGTGSEDYYGYAWSTPTIFWHPFLAQPEGLGKTPIADDPTVEPRFANVLRNRALDAIPFTKSIRFDMELFTFTPEFADFDYAPLACWYMRPGGKSNRGAEELQAAATVRISIPRLTDVSRETILGEKGLTGEDLLRYRAKFPPFVQRVQTEKDGKSPAAVFKTAPWIAGIFESFEAEPGAAEWTLVIGKEDPIVFTDPKELDWPVVYRGGVRLSCRPLKGKDCPKYRLTWREYLKGTRFRNGGSPTAKVFADFEGKDYGDWKVEGEAFGPGPAQGALPKQHPVGGYCGKGLVNTFYKGDNTKGKLTSPAFTVKDPTIRFLIGGGNYAGETCLNLIVDGAVVRTATGKNREQLEWTAWDVRDLIGKEARFEIVDSRTGHFGHINVDCICFDTAK